MKYSLILLLHYAFSLSMLFAQSSRTPETPIIIKIDSSDTAHLEINDVLLDKSAARAWLAEASIKSGRKDPLLILFDRDTSIGTISDITAMAKLTHDEVYAILKTEKRGNPFVLTSLSPFADERQLLPLNVKPYAGDIPKMWVSSPVISLPTLGRTIPPYAGGEAPFRARPHFDDAIPLPNDVLKESLKAIVPVFYRNEKTIANIQPSDKLGDPQASVGGNSVGSDLFSDTYQFIFFAVLEGLYSDGASQADVDRLLLQNEHKAYVNFIYACPICMPTLAAIRAYSTRPELYGMKLQNHQSRERTFGYGLPPEASKLLQSDEPKQRLQGVYALVNLWITRRMDKMRLSGDAREKISGKLQKARKQGAIVLQAFAKNGTLDTFAPAYSGTDECVICNAAAQMPLKFEGKGH